MTSTESRHPDGHIRLETRGHTLLMGVDRPEKRNGFTPKMLQELAEAHTRLESADELLLWRHTRAG